MAKIEKDNNFEDSIQNLENIVKKLENGNLNLDESLEEFEKGVKAYRYCNEILNQVEGKVKLIIEKENEEVKIVNFEDLD